MSKTTGIGFIIVGCVIFGLIGHFIAKERFYDENYYIIRTEYPVRIVGEDYKSHHLIVFNYRTEDREYSNVVGSEDNIGQYLYAIKTDVFDVEGNMIRSDIDYRFSK